MLKCVWSFPDVALWLNGHRRTAINASNSRVPFAGFQKGSIQQLLQLFIHSSIATPGNVILYVG